MKKAVFAPSEHLLYFGCTTNSNLTLRENIEVGAYLSDSPLDVDELMETLGIAEHQKTAQPAFPEDSSSALPLDVPL